MKRVSDEQVRRVWIAADIPSSSPGGMLRHMELHARGLRELGVEATTIYRDRAKKSGLASLDSRTPGLRLLSGTFDAIKREQPDVINVHTMSAPAFLLAKATGLLRSKIVVMSYAADERALEFARPGLRRVLQRARIAIPARTFRAAAGVWCVAREDVRYYVSRYGVEAAKVRFIPHAIEEAFFDNCPISRKRNQVLFVGTWIFRKGIDVLKRAFGVLFENNPEVSIVVAGTFEKDEHIRRYLALPSGAKLTTVSQLNDQELRTLYHESSLLVVPSRLEGMPFSMLEAMACGCPTLAAANSGMLDAIADQYNGWLMDHFDGEKWGNKLVELFHHPDELEAASRAASISANRFRLKDLSRAALDWYRSLH